MPADEGEQERERGVPCEPSTTGVTVGERHPAGRPTSWAAANELGAAAVPSAAVVAPVATAPAATASAPIPAPRDKELLPTNLPPIPPMVATVASAIGGFALKYVACFVLTAPVLLVIASLIFSYTNIFGSEMPFLRYFHFLLPYDSTGTAHLDEHDMMRIYWQIAFWLMILSLLTRGLWRLSRILLGRSSAPRSNDMDQHNEPRLMPWRKVARFVDVRRLLIVAVAITVIYLITFAVIPIADWADDSSVAVGYLVFAVFYVMAVVSAAIYVIMDSISNRLLGWALSRLQ